MLSRLAFLFITILATTEIKVQYSKELTDSSIKSFSINMELCFDDPNIKLLKDYINDLKTEVGNYCCIENRRIWREYFDTSYDNIPKTFSYTFDFNLTLEAFKNYKTLKKYPLFAEYPVIMFTINGKLIDRHTLPLLRLLFLVSISKKDDWEILKIFKYIQEKYEAKIKKYEKCIEHPDPFETRCGMYGYYYHKRIAEERLKIVNYLLKSLKNAKEKKLESNLDIAKIVLRMFVKDKMDKKNYAIFKTENINNLFNCDREVTRIFRDYDFTFLYEEILSEEENNLLKFFY